jgi:predicted RNase H-like HicB family nuclease
MVTQSKSKKDLTYYLSLPWTYTVETAEENGKILYIVHVNELPKIGTDTYSLDEALKSLKENMTILFKLWLEEGEEIPEPLGPKDIKR